MGRKSEQQQNDGPPPGLMEERARLVTATETAKADHAWWLGVRNDARFLAVLDGIEDLTDPEQLVTVEKAEFAELRARVCAAREILNRLKSDIYAEPVKEAEKALAILEVKHPMFFPAAKAVTPASEIAPIRKEGMVVYNGWHFVGGPTDCLLSDERIEQLIGNWHKNDNAQKAAETLRRNGWELSGLHAKGEVTNEPVAESAKVG